MAHLKFVPEREDKGLDFRHEVLGTDEIKIELFGQIQRAVWQTLEQPFYPENLQQQNEAS